MQCVLCNSEVCVEDSHIIPAFVIRYLKKISITGHLRGGEKPNMRMRDGPKPRLLGPKCEDMFSVWEGRFASEVFYPLHEGDLDRRSFTYGDWLSKFAVSLSWRSLWHARERHPGKASPHGHDSLIQPTLDVWRDYLLGRRADVGFHRQHMLFLGDPISLPGFLDPNELTFYFQRGIDYCTIHSPTDAYIFTKLCRILFVGTIFTKKPSDWKRTHIHIDGGSYGPGDFQTAGSVFTFFQHAVDDMIESRKRVSPNQSRKIEEAVMKKISRQPPP